MYAFALRNTTVNHIRGCVVKILYPTLPRIQSKMAIVWDRSISVKSVMGPPVLTLPCSVEYSLLKLMIRIFTNVMFLN